MGDYHSSPIPFVGTDVFDLPRAVERELLREQMNSLIARYNALTPAGAGDVVAIADIPDVVLGSKLGVLRITSGGQFGASTPNHPTSSYLRRGVDLVDGRVLVVDQTGGLLRQSEDGGVSWSNHKGFPTDVTWDRFGEMVRFGSHIYGLGRDSVGGHNVYRTPPVAGNDAFTWSGVLHSLASGATFIGTGVWPGSQYLFLVEYGSPTAGPVIYRTADGVTWETVFGPDPAMLHIHAVAEDPHNPGHIWVTTGDSNSANTIMRSIDHGDTWNEVVATSAWQAVQISFSAEWVFFAPDQPGGPSVFVIDRATLTPRAASQNAHWQIAVPGGAAGDVFRKNPYSGIVDPDTGIYYFTAFDTSASGNTDGLFYLPGVGGMVHLIEKDVGGAPTRIGGGKLWFGKMNRNLYATTGS